MRLNMHSMSQVLKITGSPQKEGRDLFKSLISHNYYLAQIIVKLLLTNLLNLEFSSFFSRGV